MNKTTLNKTPLSLIPGDAKCVLENTLIQNFATGISCAAGGNLVMNQSSISNCGSGLEIDDNTIIQFATAQITNNSDYAVFYKTKTPNVLNGEKRKIVANFDELRKLIS